MILIPRPRVRPGTASGNGAHRLALFLTGLALVLILGIGLTRPLALWHHPAIVTSTRPLATLLGPDPAGAIHLAATVLGAFAAYAVAVRLALSRPIGRSWWLVIGVTLLLSLTMLPLNPVGAHDVYHNVADARALWHYGDNPLSVPPIAYPLDPIALRVPAWQSTPSVYGPLWYLLSGLPLVAAGDDLWANVLGQKLLTAAFLLVTTVLAMCTAERIRPGAGVAAGVIVGWNPLLQFETAGNAHNDIVMLCLTLAAFYALARGWWRAVFPLLALAVAAKYIVVLLGPLLLIWMLRRRDVPRRDILISLILGALVGGCLFLPFLQNGVLITALRREASFATASPTAVLHTFLLRYLPLDGVEMLTLIKVILTPPLAVAYLVMLWRIPRDADLAALVERTVTTLLWFFAFGVAWFGPWYATILLPLGALLPNQRSAQVAMLFTAGAMLLYVPLGWLSYTRALRFHILTAMLSFGPALLLQCWPARRAPRSIRDAQPDRSSV